MGEDEDNHLQELKCTLGLNSIQYGFNWISDIVPWLCLGYQPLESSLTL